MPLECFRVCVGMEDKVLGRFNWVNDLKCGDVHFEVGNEFRAGCKNVRLVQWKVSQDQWVIFWVESQYFLNALRGVIQRHILLVYQAGRFNELDTRHLLRFRTCVEVVALNLFEGSVLRHWQRQWKELNLSQLICVLPIGPYCLNPVASPDCYAF